MGFSPARILEWLVISSSRGPSQPQESNPHLLQCRRIIYLWATRKAPKEALKVKVASSCRTLCDSMDYSPANLLCPINSPGQNIGVGSCSLLQGIFQTQESNPGLLHCGQIFFTIWATWEAHEYRIYILKDFVNPVISLWDTLFSLVWQEAGYLHCSK